VIFYQFKILNKKYDKFELKNISFALEKGFIMGFIGRNGAGKTNDAQDDAQLIHADSGTVNLFGKGILAHEIAISRKSDSCSEDLLLSQTEAEDGYKRGQGGL
jgi:ABC-2 type transport system ATP-binding protein